MGRGFNVVAESLSDEKVKHTSVATFSPLHFIFLFRFIIAYSALLALSGPCDVQVKWELQFKPVFAPGPCWLRMRRREWRGLGWGRAACRHFCRSSRSPSPWWIFTGKPSDSHPNQWEAPVACRRRKMASPRTITIVALSFALGLFFVFMGTIKLTPRLSKDAYSEMVSIQSQWWTARVCKGTRPLFGVGCRRDSLSGFNNVRRCWPK